MLLKGCCCCVTEQRAAERPAPTRAKPQKAPTCTRTRKVRPATPLPGTAGDPALTCAFLGPQTPLLSRRRQLRLKMLKRQRTTPKTPGLQADVHVRVQRAPLHRNGANGAALCLLRHPGITRGLMKGALSVAASAYKALFTGQGPTQVSRRAAAALLCRFPLSAHEPTLSAASGGRLHPGHHDGGAGGDGLRGPAPEPTPAEQVQLQPAGRRQRARSDERQRLVLHPLLKRERWEEAGAEEEFDLKLLF